MAITDGLTPPRPTERVAAAWNLTVTAVYTRSKLDIARTTGVATGTVAKMRRACNHLVPRGETTATLLKMGWPAARLKSAPYEREAREDREERYYD